MSTVRNLIQGGIRALNTRSVVTSSDEEGAGHPILPNGIRLGQYRIGIRGENGRWYPLFGRLRKMRARISNRAYFPMGKDVYRVNNRYGRPMHGVRKPKGRPPKAERGKA